MIACAKKNEENKTPPDSPHVDPTLIANYCVGILFAAHKNPSIGSAQNVLMLLEHPQHLYAIGTSRN